MEKSIFLNDKKYISARRAAEISGYSSDYIGQLIRTKKISGTLVGRSWYVDREEVLSHKNLNSIKLSKKNSKSKPTNAQVQKNIDDQNKTEIKGLIEPVEKNQYIVMGLDADQSRKAEIDLDKVLYIKEDAPLFVNPVKKFDVNRWHYEALQALKTSLSKKPPKSLIDKLALFTSVLSMLVLVFWSFTSVNKIDFEKAKELGPTSLKQEIENVWDLYGGSVVGRFDLNNNNFADSVLFDDGSVFTGSVFLGWRNFSGWFADIARKIAMPWIRESSIAKMDEPKFIQSPNGKVTSGGEKGGQTVVSKTVVVETLDRSYVDTKIAELKNYFLTNLTAPNVTRYFITNQNDSIVNSLSQPIRSLSDVTITGNSSFTGSAGLTTLSVSSSANFTGSSTMADLTATEWLAVGTTTQYATLTLDGALYLATNTAPTNTTYRLYNMNSGDLYWNGSIIAGATVGNWTTDGTSVWRTGGKVGISTTSPYAKFSITNTSADPSFIVEDSASPDSSPFIIDADGNVGIGTASPTRKLQVEGGKATFVTGAWTTINNMVEHSSGSSDYDPGLSVISANAGDTAGGINIGVYGGTNNKNMYSVIGVRQQGGGWDNGFGAVTNGTYLPGIGFAGATTGGVAGSNTTLSANIVGIVDGTVGANSMPTAILFHTSATNQSGLTEQMRISSGGNVGLATTSPYAKLSVVGSSGTLIGADAISGFTGTLFDLKLASTTKFSVDYAGNVTSAGSLTLSSVAVNSLLSTNASGAVVATSAPTFGYFNATSTAATSTIAGGLAIETSGFVYDYSTNNVGIGTASPIQKLHVAGVIQAESGDFYSSGTKMVFSASGYPSTYFHSILTTHSNATDGDNKLTFNVSNALSAGVNVLTLTGAGNAGFGTTSPYAKLSVVGDGVFTSNLNTANFTATGTATFSGLSQGFAYLGTGGKLNTGATTTASCSGGISCTSFDIFGSSPVTLSSFTYPFPSAATSTRLTFSGGLDLTYSSSTIYSSFAIASTTNLIINNSSFNNLLGSGLINSGGALTVQSGVSNLTNYDWTFLNNYGAVNLTPTSTMPIWAQGGLNASSTSHFVYASSTALTVSGNSYLNSLNLSGLAVNSLLSTDVTGNIVATSTPTFGNFNATSTAATSTIAGGLTIEGSGLVYDFSTNNLGIGTASPGNRLTVSGSASIGSSYTGTTAPSNGLIIEGNVGIGTTGPGAKLSVNGSARLIGTSVSSVTLGFGTDDGVSGWSIGNGIIDNTHNFRIYDNTNGLTRVTVDNSGNVGIGTTGPVSKLQVVTGASGAIPFGTSVTAVGSFETNSAAYLSILTPSTAERGILFGDNVSNLAGGIVYNNADTLSGLQFRVNGNSTKMVIKSDGNVGIGTTGPGQLLQVAGRGAFDDEVIIGTDYSLVGKQALRIYRTFSGTSDIYGQDQTIINNGGSTIANAYGYNLVTPAASGAGSALTTSYGMYIRDGGSNGVTNKYALVTESTAGNVGIGTTGPSDKLDVRGNITLGASLPVSIGTAPTDTITYDGDTLRNYGLTWYDDSAIAPISGQTLGISAYRGIRFFTSGVPVAVINGSGNVGIGTTAPGQKLDVAGSAAAWNFYSPATAGTFGDSGGAKMIVYGSTGSAGITNAIRFDTAGSERMRITNDGNVGIGTTSPVSKLDVMGNGYFSSNLFVGGAITGTSTLTISGTGNSSIQGNVGIGTTSPTYKLAVQQTSEGNTFQIYDTDGNCLLDPDSGGITTTCSSDARLKTNIEESNNVIEYLRNIPIKDFTVIASGDRRTGVIAQEMLVDYPELVHMGPDGYYGVSEISSWKIIKGLQEQQTMIEDLQSGQADIVLVEQRLTALEIDTQATSTTLEGGGPSLIGRILAYFKGFGLDIQNGFTRISKVFVGSLHIEGDVCVDDTCVTKDQFKEMILRSGVGAVQIVSSNSTSAEGSDSTAGNVGTEDTASSTPENLEPQATSTDPISETENNQTDSVGGSETPNSAPEQVVESDPNVASPDQGEVESGASGGVSAEENSNTQVDTSQSLTP